MSDQCEHCKYKGDIESCLEADCFQHESWYAKYQQEKIRILIAGQNALIESINNQQGE